MFTDDITRVRAHFVPWADCVIQFLIEKTRREGAYTHRSVATNVVFETLTEEDDSRMIEPTFSIRLEQAQELMDELWRCGLRPTEAAGSVGSLAATEKHLKDMRRLVEKAHEVKLT